MIITVVDELLSDNDKQLGNNLIAILNVSLSSCIISLMISILNDDDVDPAEMVSLSSCIISLMISILNDDDVDPAEMVSLNISAVDMAKSTPATYIMCTTFCHYINNVTTLHYH